MCRGLSAGRDEGDDVVVDYDNGIMVWPREVGTSQRVSISLVK